MGNASGAARIMAAFEPHDYLCGAEINSLHYLLDRKELGIRTIHLLVSDSNDGATVGAAIKHYLEERSDLSLRIVTVHRIKELDANDPAAFAHRGLRNLVRTIGEIVHKAGPLYSAIDATGGYKAQTAMAVLMGQMFQIPAYYRFMNFETIIDFPPIPVTFNFDRLAEHLGTFAALERGESITEEQAAFPSDLRVLVERVQVDRTWYVDLNPLGQALLLAFRVQVPPRAEFPPIAAGGRKEPIFADDHHYPIGFKQYVESLWKRETWICHTHAILRQAEGYRGIHLLRSGSG